MSCLFPFRLLLPSRPYFYVSVAVLCLFGRSLLFSPFLILLLLTHTIQYLDSSNTFFTTPVRTSAGATLNGIITLTSSSGSSFNYNSQFTNIGGTSLSITGAAQLTWATETLEAYGVTSINNYPAGSTVFSGINLKLASGATPSVSWSHVNDAADGLSTTINTNGATGAKITIAY